MIYLDHNASTPISSRVLEEMQRVAPRAFGNPGSRHLAGRRSRQILEEARERIAFHLGADSTEIIFTSGATEATNLALHGYTQGRSGVVQAVAGEHPATAETLAHLARNDLEIQWLPLGELGHVQSQAVIDFDPAQTLLFTALLANNETGVIQNLDSFITRCREHNVPVHLDAVQAIGKIPVHFRNLGVTSLSVAAHKFYGPRGIGALVLSKNAKITPIMFGGFQESGLRPGTESVILAHGMAVALDEAISEMSARMSRIGQLRDQLENGLLERCSNAKINGDRHHRLATTTNISFVGCEGDALLIALDLAGLCCSLGSACASGSIEPSPVLLAMGLEAERYRSAVRFSLGEMNSADEINVAIERIAEVVRRLTP